MSILIIVLRKDAVSAAALSGDRGGGGCAAAANAHVLRKSKIDGSRRFIQHTTPQECGILSLHYT